jgi:hypothetical protein
MRSTSFSRRDFLKASAGAAAAAATLAALGPAAVLGAPPAGKGGRLVPPGKVGTILFTQRDAISRRGIWDNPNPTMGFLGGPNFPDDPNDLGPLVPLPGGFLEVFEFLAAAGYQQIEFAGYGQNANNQGGTTPSLGSGTNPNRANFPAYLDYARTLRSFLDATGLRAVGNHGFIPNTWPGPSSAGGEMHPGEYDRFQIELEFASILGMELMGTGGDPTSANNRNIEPWDVAAEKWTALNELGRAWGVRIYPHNHSPAYNFLQDGPMVEVTVNRITGDPLTTPQMVRGESGIRLMEHYYRITDEATCPAEIDIFWAHVAQHQHRWYYDWDGQRQEAVFDPLALVAAQPKRFPLYHAKDGQRTAQSPGVGNGYNMIPFQVPESDIDYATFFRDDGPRGFHSPNYEQDNAPGGGSDPGQSLRVSKLSSANMLAMRG